MFNKKISREKIKTWFVTGASSGVGHEICKQLLDKGYNVIAVSRRVPSFNHNNVLCLSVDVTKPESIKSAIDKGIEKFGSIEVLSNNAGISSNCTVEEETIENMKKIMETNFWGSYNTIHEFLPYFRKKRIGTIVNNSSQSGIMPRAFGAAYCSSKYALEGLTSVLRLETKKFCRVMTFELGYFMGTNIGKDSESVDNTALKEYSDIPMSAVKVKYNKQNDLKKAVRFIIEEIEKEKPQRRLFLGGEVIKKIPHEINSLKNDLRKSKSRALACGTMFEKNNAIMHIKTSDKNIALLNFHWEMDNFGAVLTLYALNKFMNNLGYNAQNIDYIPTFSWIREEDDNDYFINFRKKYLPSTQRFNDLWNIENLNNEFTHFMVGSDQVFRNSFIKHDLEAYFLNFANPDKNIISVAASFGSDDIEEETGKNLELYKKYLSNFNSLSIREKTGVDFCKKIGFNAQLLIDPVFYLEKSDWENLANQSEEKSIDKIVYYTINPNIENDIKIFIDKNKNLMGGNEGKNITFNSPVEQWLYKIKNCDLLIADSFHAVCFAIIFNKNFICVNKNMTTSTRMPNLMNQLEIKDRLYASFEDVNLEKIYNSSIDYDLVNEKIAKLRDFAKNWIINAIENPKNDIERKIAVKKEISKIYSTIARINYIKFVIKNGLYKIRAKLNKKKRSRLLAKVDSSRRMYRNYKYITKNLKKYNGVK